MQRKSLTAIQGYFIASIILMHVLFGVYHFWVKAPEQADQKPNSMVSAIGDTAPSASTPNVTDAVPAGPQPPEAGHIDINTMTLENDEYLVTMEEDWQASLTLDAELQTLSHLRFWH